MKNTKKLIAGSLLLLCASLSASAAISQVDATNIVIGVVRNPTNNVIFTNLVSFLPVTAYGAIGDGLADDTAAIQRALDTGKFVYLPRKATTGITKYKITSSLTVPSGGGLAGVGKYATQLDAQWATSDTTAAIIMTAGNNTVRDLGITSTTLTSVTNNNAWSGFSRSIQAGNGSFIQNVYVENAVHGIVLSSASAPATNVTLIGVTCQNIRSSDGSGAAIYSGRGFDINISDINLTNCDRGIEVENGSRNVFANSGYLKTIYPTGYIGMPVGYITNYTFVLDAHTHTGEGIVENVHYKDFTLESVGVGCITANAQDWISYVRNVSFKNINISNLVDINFVTASASALTGINNADGIVLENVSVAPQIMTNKTFVANITTTKNVTVRDCKFYVSTPTIIAIGSDSVGTIIERNLFTSTYIRVTNRARASNVATLKTDGAHGLVVGQTIGIANIAASGAGFSTASATVASTAASDTFTYANTGADVSAVIEHYGFLYMGGGTSISDFGLATVVEGNKFIGMMNGGNYLIRQESLASGGSYKNNSAVIAQTFYTASRARSSNVATITTTKSHNLKAGDYVVVENLASAGYNTSGSVVIIAVSTTTFTYANAGGDEGTTADTAGDVYNVLGYASTGSPAGLVRLTGQISTVSGNTLINYRSNNSSPLCNVESTVTGGALAIVTGNVGWYARTDATVFTSGSTVSNYTLANNTANLSSLLWTIQGSRILSYANVSGGANVGTVGFFDNVTNLNHFGAMTNSGTLRQTGIATFISTASIPTNTAAARITTTDMALNTYYTNDNQRMWIAETFSLTSALTGSAVVALYLDQDADGTFESTGMQISQGVIVAEQANLQLCGWVNPGARYMYTNILGTGASASVVTGSGQRVSQ